MQAVRCRGRKPAGVVGAVEFEVAQKVLRAVGTAFEIILARAGESQVMLADVPQGPFGPEVVAGLVRWTNRKRS